MTTETSQQSAVPAAANDITQRVIDYLLEHEQSLRDGFDSFDNDEQRLKRYAAMCTSHNIPHSPPMVIEAPLTRSLSTQIRSNHLQFKGHFIDQRAAHGHIVYGNVRTTDAAPVLDTITLFDLEYHYAVLEGGFHPQGPLTSLQSRMQIPLSMMTESTMLISPWHQFSDEMIRSMAIIVLRSPHLSNRWEQSKLTAKGDNEVSDIAFIETWTDNREAKVHDLCLLYPIYHHDFARCEICNGEIEFRIPEQSKIKTVSIKEYACSHCKQPSTLLKSVLTRLYGGDE